MSAFTPYQRRKVLEVLDSDVNRVPGKEDVKHKSDITGIDDSKQVLLSSSLQDFRRPPQAHTTPLLRFPPTNFLNIPQASSSVDSVRTMLQIYSAAVYSIGIQADVHEKGRYASKMDKLRTVNVKNDVSEEKGSKFLMKNILSGVVKKEDVEDRASRLEMIASSIGKMDAGHRCIYCGKVYSRKYGLKIHIRTHTGYKPLKCKICLRPFGDPSNLNKHVRLHSQGSTPYKCLQCDKILVRKRDLDRHMLARHPTYKQNTDRTVTKEKTPDNR